MSADNFFSFSLGVIFEKIYAKVFFFSSFAAKEKAFGLFPAKPAVLILQPCSLSSNKKKRVSIYEAFRCVCLEKCPIYTSLGLMYKTFFKEREKKRAFSMYLCCFFCFSPQLRTSSFFPSFVSHFPPDGEMCTDCWTISPYFGIKRPGAVSSGSDIRRHQRNNTKSKDEHFTQSKSFQF